MEKNLDRLLADAKIVPAVNQIELHPHFSKKAVTAHCEKLGIAVKPGAHWGAPGSKLLEDAVLNNIAKKHKKTAAQVALRWELQKGIITIPEIDTPGTNKREYESLRF